MTMKREITFKIDGEYIERLINAVAERSGLEVQSSDGLFVAQWIEDAVKSYVRTLEREAEDERRRMEEFDDSDVPF
jgi:hypothetical protein